jgi:trehalose 6-phosphate synthase
LVIVSNRVALPEKSRQTSGGLVTGVLDALREAGGIWFGWSGEIDRTRPAKPRVTEADGLTYATVDLTREDHGGYYNGFSYAALWPLFHYRLDLVEFARRDFAACQRVNTLFADHLAPMLLPDDLIWVHDWHLIPMAEICAVLASRSGSGSSCTRRSPPSDARRPSPSREPAGIAVRL